MLITAVGKNIQFYHFLQWYDFYHPLTDLTKLGKHNPWFGIIFLINASSELVHPYEGS